MGGIAAATEGPAAAAPADAAVTTSTTAPPAVNVTHVAWDLEGTGPPEPPSSQPARAPTTRKPASAPLDGSVTARYGNAGACSWVSPYRITGIVSALIMAFML